MASKIKLTALLLCGVCFAAYSQDYVVTTKGDTLHGKVKVLFFDQIDKVQVKEKKKKTFTALQVRSLSLKNEVYHPVRIHNSVQFMKLLKGGYLSLYAFRMEGQTTYGGRYLVKRDGGATEVPNLQFKKNMNKFFEDCPELAEKIESGSYGRGDLDKIMADYDAYIEQNTAYQRSVSAAVTRSTKKAEVLEALKKDVETAPDFASKNDALTAINDMLPKLKKGENVPNYLVDALKGYLAGVEPAKENLEKFVAAMKE